MTSFQNPMGATVPEAKKQQLVELLRRHQVPLIEDDVYAELYYGQQAPKPAKAFDTEGLVMHCGCTGADFFADAKVQELYSVELWEPVG